MDKILVRWKGLQHNPLTDVTLYNDGEIVEIKSGNITLTRTRDEYEAHKSITLLKGGRAGARALESSGLFTKEELALMNGVGSTESGEIDEETGEPTEAQA